MTVAANKQRRGRIAAPGRVFPPARILALAVIGVLILSLGYLRFAPDRGSVSVPAGAHAGDLTMKPCSYATENGSYAADCGTLVVPENRSNPRSRLIALPVTRIRARSANGAEPIFRLEGGPGITNMTFKDASRFADNRDVVLVGYRGVDGSSVLACPEVTSALKHATAFLSDTSFRAYGDALRDCAQRLTNNGVDLAGYSRAQRVDDLDTARIALGYGRIDLLSESAGTRTALIYAWRYPTSIHRSVMIGVNPPGHYLWDPATTDEQLRRYAAQCTADDQCRTRTDDLAASMQRTAAHIPDRWWFLPIKEANVRIASFFGLFETTATAAPLSGPMTLDSWLAAANGDPSGFWLLSLMSDLTLPTAFVWGEYAATGVQDAQVAHAYYAAGGDPGSILGNAGTDFAWGGGSLAEAWPASPGDEEYRQVRTSDVETLLIGGALDFSTPTQVATNELLPSLPNGHQVVLANFGHTTSFWNDQPDAGTRLISTFFASGQVDDSRYTPARVNFTPGVTQTALAKGIAGTMVGLAVITVLSLLWMARRLYTRGRVGHKVSATLRSLSPIVLGLGGWCLGALIVLTTMPGVPLDDHLLATLAVGVPIGLGIFFAWVNRDWSATTKAVGFATAAGGALIGAWLGCNATEGLVALITTIVGASVGANLALILLDIAWDRRVRDRFAATTAKATLEARPATG